MPAYFEDGFSVRQPMWHGLGTVLSDYPNRDVAFGASGQAWTVEETPMFIAHPTDPYGQPRRVEGYFAATRSDDHRLLAVHQNSYEVLQNSEGWDLAEAIVDQDQALRYETAVSLKGGKVNCVLVRDESFTIPGDDSTTIPYLLVSWAHDGSAAMVATATNIRVVCWNTLNLALKSGQTRFSFRHTRNVRDRIEAAKAAVSGMRTNTQLYQELAASLAKQPVTMDEVAAVRAEFIPAPEFWGSMQGYRIAQERTSQNRLRFSRLLQSPSVPDELRYTRYGLLQAGVEYLDWSRKAKSQETRFGRAMLDPASAKAKQRLLDLVQV